MRIHCQSDPHTCISPSLTVDGQVIGVHSSGTALLQLGCGAQIDINGITAEKGVHVALVLARHDNRVDVLAHEGLDLGVGKGACQTSGGQENG